MKPVRLLVTGASGLLGGRLAQILSGPMQVTGCRHRGALPPGIPAIDLDLLDAASTSRGFELARPDAVLHSAAIADADLCEREPALAERTNVAASEALARLCAKRGVQLIALSTDLVFGGDHGPVCEADAPAPLMTYARTKLESEAAVLAECANAAVLRIALVYGLGHGPRATASEAVAWTLAAGQTPRLFTDQIRTPVDAESVADAVRRIQAQGASGRFHIGGPERLSRHAFGIRVAQVLGLDASRIHAAQQADADTIAPRPADVSLDSTRAMRELGWRPRPLDVAIAEGRPAREL